MLMSVVRRNCDSSGCRQRTFWCCGTNGENITRITSYSAYDTM